MKIVDVCYNAGIDIQILGVVTQVAAYRETDGKVVYFDVPVSLGIWA